jgi:CubicO group peptidase (beta-lactamase class C family)
MRKLMAAVGVGAVALLAAAPAHAAKSCAEPGEQWERATPAEAGMDAAKLQDAMDYGTSQLSFAVRVYRHGCLVGEDRAAEANRNKTFESYSMAKSVTAMVFGRAMTLGLISPNDLVGSLVPEADGPHGEITMLDLLTMTSGLRWNGFRDYNVFTMPDRIRDALTLEIVHEPGTYYEYAQSAVTLLAEAVGRAAGEDFEAFAQRELMDPLAIPDDAWHWERDRAGHVLGFMGVNMRPDDFGRLGELMRRGGVWRGRRLLSRGFMSNSVAPSARNGCYGWLIWLNAAAPCIGPTVQTRPVEDNREYPDLPADLYHFSGLFGQIVSVFPSQGIVIARMGQDPSLLFAGGADWEHELYLRVLGAVTDQQIERPGDAPPSGYQKPNPDYGFGNSLREPDQYSRGMNQDPLPPAGPRRARAAQLSLGRSRVGRSRRVAIVLACPPRWPGEQPHACTGLAKLTGARAQRYSVSAGDSERLGFRLRPRAARRLARRGTRTLLAWATNADAADGVTTRVRVTVRAR